MIHFKFTRKNVRRLCVTMALIAPIIYLFGSLFAGLNGAHGQQIFADDESSTYVQEGVFNQGYWVRPETGEYYYAGNGYLATDLVVLPFGASSRVLITDSQAYNFFTLRIFYYAEDLTLIDFVSYGDVSEVGFTPPSGAYGLRLAYAYSNGGSYRIESVYQGTLTPLSSSNFSDYVFGHFFAHDNFLSKIGEDAISETPHGFAPFGSLFRYVDDVAFHMGDTQVGLMAYGYMYWCAHVLLFDVLFMMTTFFISFIERVGDRIGGNE